MLSPRATGSVIIAEGISAAAIMIETNPVCLRIFFLQKINLFLDFCENQISCTAVDWSVLLRVL
jgi:hypothetical protein